MRGADFFRDEVRCGFYIPTVIKQAWAAVLDVFDEIDRICVKHNIRYFAFYQETFRKLQPLFLL